MDEWEVARDYNSITSVRKYHAHLSRVSDTCFSPASNWILSSGRDKYFYFHCTVTGKRLGGYLCNAWCTGLAYDEEAQYVFVGDYSGAITVCKLEQSGVKFINTLKVCIKLRDLSICHCYIAHRVTAAVSSVWPGMGQGTGFTPPVMTPPCLCGTSGGGGARCTSCTGTGAR